jgi:hypothetical protein
VALSRPRPLAAMALAVSVIACSGNPSPAPSAGASPAGASGSPIAPSGAIASPGAGPSAATGEPTATPQPVVGDSFGILSAPPEPFAGTITCSGAIGADDPVAVVFLHGATSAVLRDYADLAHPRTACDLGSVQVMQLIDARHIVIASQPDQSSIAFAVVDLPGVRYHWFQVPKGSFGNRLLAVSPHLDQVLWNQVEDGVAYDRIHLATATGDHVLAKLPDTNAGRCGAPTDSNNAAFSHDQSALFVLDEPLPEISLIVAAHSKIVLSDIGTAKAKASTRPLYALWSPTDEVVYFTKSGNVWQWSPSLGLTIFLPGVTWDAATISADGAHLAYQVTTTSGSREVWLMDLAHGGSPAKVSDGSGPVFLNDRQLFLFASAAGSGCVGETPGKPVIYNVATRSRATSVIDQVGFVWPATGTHN